MRVLCSTTAGEGHFGPLKAVAIACRAAGHDVRVAAPASFAGAVGRAGLPHVPFPDVPAELIHPLFAGLSELSLDEANRTVMGEVFGRLDARYAFLAVRELIAAWRPDVVVREPAEFASLAAAEAARIPHAEVAIGVAALMEWARDPLGGPLRELDQLAGLPDGHLLRAMVDEPVFTTVPPSMDAAPGRSSADGGGRRTVRFRTASLPVDGRLPGAWGNPDHPLVYVTFGTVAAGLGHLDDVFRAALDSLADLPVRVLLTTGYAGAVETGEPPGNARVEKFWPQHEVMPMAAAVVGHGGFGTTMGALSTGVPQVVLPLFTTDQHLNADRVAAMGVGVRVDGGPDAARRLGPAVARVLADPSFTRRARALAAEIASLPDERTVVAGLEELGRAAPRSTGTAGPGTP